jgi:galactonate dehydratase
MPRVASLSAVRARITPRTTWVFARVAATDGTQGWGEGTLEGRADEVAAAIQTFEAKLRGREIAKGMDLGPIPGKLVEAAALSAVDQALWDLAARAAGRPLAALLGGIRRDRMALYANINRGTTDRARRVLPRAQPKRRDWGSAPSRSHPSMVSPNPKDT